MCWHHDAGYGAQGPSVAPVLCGQQMGHCLPREEKSQTKPLPNALPEESFGAVEGGQLLPCKKRVGIEFVVSKPSLSPDL